MSELWRKCGDNDAADNLHVTLSQQKTLPLLCEYQIILMEKYNGVPQKKIITKHS